MTVAATRVQPTLTVGDIARASGVAASAIRFYENHGLIASARTAGNQRRFYPVDGCLVRVIRVAQRVGLTIAEIQELLADLPADRSTVGLREFLRIRRRLEAEARRRIHELTAALDDLASDQKLCEIPSAE